jgi:predicted  nucleic acid-binding Zn-ribbon protein
MDYSVFVGPVQALLGALCAVLWSALTETKKKAEKVEAELAAYKVEAAEKFTTKHELRTALESITKALEQQGSKMENRFDKLEERLNKMIEQRE